MEKRIFKTQLAGRTLEVEVGQLAQFANGSVLMRYGDTVVLATATAAEPREGIDFFPLSVDYEEKMYAIGKIPGGFLRREGRPTEKATLVSRMIDRQIRPFFPKDMRDDVTVNNLVLSVDQDNAPEAVAMLASSLALSISDIPWEGPIAGVAVGLIDGQVIISPTVEQAQASEMELTVAGSETKIVMIEAGANEVPDEVMLDAIKEAHIEIKNLINFFKEVTAEVGKAKYSYTSFELNQDVYQSVSNQFEDRVKTAMHTADKEERDRDVSALRAEIASFLEQAHPDFVGQAGAFLDKLEKSVVRAMLKQDQRVDNRGMHEIRPLHAEVDVLPRTHGSGLFQRGQTQVLSIVTLGTLSNAQTLDSIDYEVSKRYMHQYNFPSYSVGETKPSRGPGRREIGHGALAERALVPVLPSEEEFPYAIRVVSEVTMSNGSTSQGSVCGSTLALMAAGVPIKRPVAGISSGLISNPDDDQDYKVFMDIQGIEDFFGDMDFKVAGTTEGITAIQVDIKNKGLTYDMIRDAFAITKEGRLQIINEVIKPAIDQPRAELSRFAPKIESIDIPADKIREVIGSGGKNIKRITEESGCEIDIQEDGPVGHVFIASPDSDSAETAIKLIRTIAFDPEPGEVFAGTVTRLMNFGAFVEYAPGKEGLVHISKLSWDHVDKVEDVVEPGQKVRVIVYDIDSQGRVNLSMRDLMPKPEGLPVREDNDRRDQRRDNREGQGNRDSGSNRGHGRNRDDKRKNFDRPRRDFDDDDRNVNVRDF